MSFGFEELLLYAFLGQTLFSFDNLGMMGSGKTTVGKILSDALGYSFVDRYKK